MRTKWLLVLSVALLMIFSSSCLLKFPIITVSWQNLNWEPGEPVLLQAAPFNFEAGPSASFTWSAEKDISMDNTAEWVDISDRIFPHDTRQSKAVLYLPEWPDDSRVRITVRIQDMQGGLVSTTRTLNYGDIPGVLVEVFQKDQSFTTPDSWFRTSGIKATARTPVYFRYHEEVSSSAVVPIPDDPIEARYYWGVFPHSPAHIDTRGTVYFHATNELNAPTTTTAIGNRFLDADVAEEIPGDKTIRWRIALVADLNSMDPAKPWRTTAWRADIYAQLTADTELYLVRARKSDFVVTDVVSLNYMLPAAQETEEAGPESVVIVTELDITEAGVGIGPLWNENYYFGLVILDYQGKPAQSVDPHLIDPYHVKGAQMVFSPSVHY